MESKQRKGYIDLAKGICIVCVMAQHLSHDTILSSPYITSFRMPFYFFICGLFVSTQYTYKQFAIKKVNALLVPFAFFSALALITALITASVKQPVDYMPILKTIISPYSCINGPLWFLICLFSAYMMYFGIKKSLSNPYLQAIAVFGISVAGFYMSRFTLWGHHIILPFFLSTSMTSLSFIYLGGLFREKSNIFTQMGGGKDTVYFLLSLLTFITIQYTTGPNHIEMIWNKYSQSYLITVLGGISGSTTIIYLCKFIKRVPIISYIGRYSLIALAMHSILLPHIKFFSNSNLNLLVLIIVLCPTIYIFKTYLPKLCAQQPFFKVS